MTAYSSNTLSRHLAQPLLSWPGYCLFSVAFVGAYVLLPSITQVALKQSSLTSGWLLLISQLAIPAGWLIAVMLVAKQWGMKQCRYLLALHSDLPPLVAFVETLQLVAGQLVAILFLLIAKELLGLSSVNPYDSVAGNLKPFLMVLALFVAPWLEELVFRGWLQTILIKHFGPKWAIALCALLFTLFHVGYQGNWHAMAYVFILGGLYSLWRYRTGTILPGIMAHALNNLLAIQFLMV